MSTQYCKLIMVTANNNNKYYEMNSDGNTIDITFGRIEGGAQKTSKPHSNWDRIYKSKIKKGYKDVTPTADLVLKVNKKNTKKKTHPFIDAMMSYRDKRVNTKYSVSSSQVTDSQKKEAQDIINELKSSSDDPKKEVVNSLLLDLYTVIPRKMKNTKDHLYPLVTIPDLLKEEQDNLDSISSVIVESSELNIDIDQFNDMTPVDYLLKQLMTSKTHHDVYRIDSNEENNKFNKWMSGQDNKDIKYLIHGTRCSSVIPILETGLQIRPSGNFAFSGKAYGDGNYFSEVVQKSLNYTGYDKDRVLFIYEVHVGNPFIYKGWFRGNSFDLNYDELRSRNFDSTYVTAGNGLLNSEIITYKEQQCRLTGVIWCRN